MPPPGAVAGVQSHLEFTTPNRRHVDDRQHRGQMPMVGVFDQPSAAKRIEPRPAKLVLLESIEHRVALRRAEDHPRA